MHSALAECMESVRALGKAPDSSIIRGILRAQTTAYRDEVSRKSLEGVDQSHVEFITNEQCCLLEGLVWSWVRWSIPTLVEDFEIIDIEREETLDIDEITIMSRPDIILRRKEDGKLGNHDFKTAAVLSESWIEDWRDSIQMAVGSMGVEARLGEKVEHYYLHALVKGRHKFFTNRLGRATEERRQESKLCYARFYPPQPPLVSHVTWDLKGYWYEKIPIWEVDFGSQKPTEMTNSEFWVSKLPDSIAGELLAFAGPYVRQDQMMEDLKEEIPAEERRWVRNLWALHNDFSPYNLNKLFPRSYNCNAYGSKCEFYSPCREGGDLSSFQQRESHHEPEAEQMRERGLS